MSRCVGMDKAFPLPGGRWSRRDRMRVGIVGCNGHRTGGWGHPPLRVFPCRGRCPQRPGIPPPLCGPPPFHKGGCCYASSGSLVKGSWHGAAVTEGFRTPVVPLIRHGLRPCHLLPCGAKAIAVPSGALKCRWPSPHPSRLRHATFPWGKAFLQCIIPSFFRQT